MTIPLKSALFFKVMLNRFHAGVGEAYLKNLPSGEVKEVFKQPISSSDTGAALSWIHALIKRTHYSWLAPMVKQLSEEMQKLAVSALDSKQSGGLIQMLNLKYEPRVLTPKVKNFILDQLYERWKPVEALPLEYLPPSTLRPLLDMSKGELVKLIDYLALYDVAEVVRNIVDKNKLTAIYRCLSPKKQQFLRGCLHKKERIVAPKLDINKWAGDVETFNTILHRRGIFRFSTALSGQSSSFMWHLTHILDTGRGAIITANCKTEVVSGVTPHLVQQILYVIDFFKQQSGASE